MAEKTAIEWCDHTWSPWWIDELREQCSAAGVPFFFKQWGGRNADAGGCELDGAEIKQWPRAA